MNPTPTLPTYDWQILVTPGHTIAARARRLSVALVALSFIGFAGLVYSAGLTNPLMLFTRLTMSSPVTSAAPDWTKSFVKDPLHFYPLGHVDALYPVGFGFLNNAASVGDSLDWYRSSIDYLAQKPGLGWVSHLQAAPFKDPRLDTAVFQTGARDVLQQYAMHGTKVADWQMPEGTKLHPVVTSVAKFRDHLGDLDRGVVVIGTSQSYILANTKQGLQALILSGSPETNNFSCRSLFGQVPPCSIVFNLKGDELADLNK